MSIDPGFGFLLVVLLMVTAWPGVLAIIRKRIRDNPGAGLKLPRRVSPAELAFGRPVNGFIRRGKLLRMMHDPAKRREMEELLAGADWLGAVIYRNTNGVDVVAAVSSVDGGWDRAAEWSDMFYARYIYEKPWGKSK